MYLVTYISIFVFTLLFMIQTYIHHTPHLQTISVLRTSTLTRTHTHAHIVTYNHKNKISAQNFSIYTQLHAHTHICSTLLYTVTHFLYISLCHLLCLFVSISLILVAHTNSRTHKRHSTRRSYLLLHLTVDTHTYSTLTNTT